MNKLLSLATLLALAIACSAGDSPESLETVATDTADPSTPPAVEVGWYSVDGDVDVVAAQVDTGSLTLTLWEKDPRGRPVLVCTETIAVETPPSVQGPLDEVELYGMWNVDMTVTECTGAPAALSLGIGPLDRDLWPAVEAAGYSMRHARGLYVHLPDGLVVFGSAGTTEQLEGRGAPTSLEKMPDGAYHLSTAYLLPL